MALESSTWLLQYMRHLLLSQVATIVIVIIMWFVIHRGDMGAKEHGFLHRKQQGCSGGESKSQNKVYGWI